MVRAGYGVVLCLCFTWLAKSLALAAELPPEGSGWTLPEVIALALERNPDLAQAQARAAAAVAKVREAESVFYPQVAARLGFARTDDPARAFGMILSQRRFRFDSNFNKPGPTQDVFPELVATYRLFQGGQDWFLRQAAGAGARAAQAQVAATRNALMDSAAQAYYALLIAPEQVAVAEAARAAVQAALESAQARLRAGAALESDVLSLQARLAAIDAAALRARNGVEIARAALRLVLALEATEPVAVRPSGDLAATLPQRFEEALQRAHEQRAELAAARAVVAQREAELAAARAAYLPRVDLVGSFGQHSDELSWSSRRDSWLFAATAELDLFTGLRRRERVQAAERLLDEARQQERQARANVDYEVRSAFANWEEARQRVEVTRAAVAHAEEALHLVSEQYRLGAATVTRYLEAEAAHTEARAQAVAAQYDRDRAAAALRKAIGGWEEVQP